MAENTGLSAADVALLNNDGMGGWNGMIWLFAIIALMGGGFGGFGYGNNGAVSSLNGDMQRGFDQQNTMAQTRDILAAEQTAQRRLSQLQPRTPQMLSTLSRTATPHLFVSLATWKQH